MSWLESHLINESAHFYGNFDRGLKFYSPDDEDGPKEGDYDNGKYRTSKSDKFIYLRYVFRIFNSTLQS